MTRRPAPMLLQWSDLRDYWHTVPYQPQRRPSWSDLVDHAALLECFRGI